MFAVREESSDAIKCFDVMTRDIILLVVSLAWQLLCHGHIPITVSHGVAGLLVICSAAKATLFQCKKPCRLGPCFH